MHGTLSDFHQGERVDADEFLTLPCDVLVPAAVERVINGENAGKLRCRVLAEAANGPTTPEADEILNQRWAEIFVIPDILCNSGESLSRISNGCRICKIFSGPTSRSPIGYTESLRPLSPR